MPSVQELLAVLEADKSPFISLMEGVAGGYATAQQKRVQNAKALLEIEALRQEQEQQKRRIAEDLRIRTEQKTRNELRGAGGVTPTTPLGKMKKTQEQDPKTGLWGEKITYEEVTPKEISYQPREYVDPQGVPRTGAFNPQNGKTIMSPDDAPVYKKPDADKPKPQTGAQKAVDRTFGVEYNRYVASGGYADTINQIQTLEGVLKDLETGSANLTGGGLTMLPDAIRKRTFSKSMAAQQAVEQSVQRTLKQVLGGQFTEKEGTAFMQRGYDTALPEEENAIKLRRAIGQLKSMALSKQKAVDYYEENGSLDGFKGEFYMLKDGEVVKATKDDFYKMMGGESPSSGGSTVPPPAGGNGKATPKKIGRFTVEVVP